MIVPTLIVPIVWLTFIMFVKQELIRKRSVPRKSVNTLALRINTLAAGVIRTRMEREMRRRESSRADSPGNPGIERKSQNIITSPWLFFVAMNASL